MSKDAISAIEHTWSIANNLTVNRPTGLLHHYTTQDGLLGIVKSGHFWVSDLRFLNDSQEFEYGLSLLKKRITDGIETAGGAARAVIDEILHVVTSWQPKYLLVASFSEHGDSLSQWRAYPGVGGYCLGFDFTTDFLPTPEGDWWLKGQWLTKCIYDVSDQEKLIDDLCHYLVRHVPKEIAPEARYNPADNVAQIFPNIAPSLKHPSFREEAEWRYCQLTTDDNESAEPGFARQQDIEFRSGPSFPVPYAVSDLGGNLLRRLKVVRVGPAPNPDVAVSAVRRLLESHGIGNVEVKKSDTPFRSW